MTYRALELFCGGGLVALGLHQAGFETTGVDNRRQRSYPSPFLLHDALTLDERLLDDFPLIWASPPCLKHTVMHGSARREQIAHEQDETQHPDLIAPTRKMLRAWAARTGGKYVIENVMKAPLIDPVVLCGSMFGLSVEDDGRRFYLERHRKFETNWPLEPPACAHAQPVIGIYGGHARNRAAKAGGRGSRDAWTRPHAAIMGEAMGLPADHRMTGNAISQGVPPAFARYVAEQLIEHLELERWAA